MRKGLSLLMAVVGVTMLGATGWGYDPRVDGILPHSIPEADPSILSAPPKSAAPARPVTPEKPAAAAASKPASAPASAPATGTAPAESAPAEK
jgi:hypothetical protein